MTAQGLTGADGACSLSGMVDDRDGDGVATLRFAQEGEQWRDIAADILIDAMQTHERIEDEQPRLRPGDGLIETCAVGFCQTSCQSRLPPRHRQTSIKRPPEFRAQ